MIGHVKELAAEISKALPRDADIFTTLQIVSEELAKLNVDDFQSGVRTDFLKVREHLRRLIARRCINWQSDGVQDIGRRLVKVLESYSGANMAAYNLLDGQKELLRQLVHAHKKSGLSSFNYSLTNEWEGIWFDKHGMERIAFEADSNDLEVLASEGLIQLCNDDDAQLSGGSVRQSAIDAVTNNFKRPASADSPGVIYQTFYAPVGAVNTGGGTIEIGTQHVGISTSEISSIVTDLRGLIPTLPPPAQTEAVENLNDFVLIPENVPVR